MTIDRVINNEIVESAINWHALRSWTNPDDGLVYNIQALRFAGQNAEIVALGWVERKRLTASPTISEYHDGTYTVEVIDGQPYDAPVLLSKTPEMLYSTIQTEIDAQFQASIDQLKTGYSQDEIQSWDAKKQEAQAWDADNTAPTPLLSAIATSQGISLADLVNKVLTNAVAYAQAYGTAEGQMKKRLAELNAIDLESPTALEQLLAV